MAYRITEEEMMRRSNIVTDDCLRDLEMLRQEHPELFQNCKHFNKSHKPKKNWGISKKKSSKKTLNYRENKPNQGREEATPCGDPSVALSPLLIYSSKNANKSKLFNYDSDSDNDADSETVVDKSLNATPLQHRKLQELREVDMKDTPEVGTPVAKWIEEIHDRPAVCSPVAAEKICKKKTKKSKRADPAAETPIQKWKDDNQRPSVCSPVPSEKQKIMNEKPSSPLAPRNLNEVREYVRSPLAQSIQNSRKQNVSNRNEAEVKIAKTNNTCFANENDYNVSPVLLTKQSKEKRMRAKSLVHDFAIEQIF